jgi:hypothetical protein
MDPAAGGPPSVIRLTSPQNGPAPAKWTRPQGRRLGAQRAPEPGQLGSARVSVEPRPGSPLRRAPAPRKLRQIAGPPQVELAGELPRGSSQPWRLPDSGRHLPRSGLPRRCPSTLRRSWRPLPRGLRRGFGGVALTCGPPPAAAAPPGAGSAERRAGGRAPGGRAPVAALAGAARLVSRPGHPGSRVTGVERRPLRSTEGRRHGGKSRGNPALIAALEAQWSCRPAELAAAGGDGAAPCGGTAARWRSIPGIARHRSRAQAGKRPSRPGAWAPGRLGGFLVAAHAARSRGGPRAANRTRRGLALVGRGWQGLAAAGRVHAASARSMRAALARAPRLAAR